MPRDTQRSFAGGVLGDVLHSSADLERYRASVAAAQNMIGVVPRGATRAPGTAFIANAKTNSGFKRLIPFSYADGDAYAIELGHLYARFLRDGGYIELGGAPYEIATPWTATALESLDYRQGGNVLYIVTGAEKIWRLNRLAHNNWTITETVNNEGPLLTPNGDEAKAIRVTNGNYEKGTTAALLFFGFTLTAADVGTIYRIDDLADATGVAYWAAGQKPVASGYIRYAENVYQVTAISDIEESVFSANPPLHTEGFFVDGTEKPVTMKFIHGDYGLMKITSVTGGGTTANAVILKNLPRRIINGNFWTWWKGAWSPAQGGPDAIAEKGSRLWFGKGARLDATRVGGFGATLDFKLGAEADAAIGAEPSQRNPVRWIEDLGALIVGTSGGVSSMSSGGRRQAIAASPLPPLTPETQEGCAKAKPLISEGALLYINDDRQKIIQITLDDTGEAFNDSDLTIMNPDVLAPGAQEMTFARNPDRIIAVPLIDGSLAFLVHQREQNIIGWWPQVRQNAIFLSACAVRRSDGFSDDIYFIVQRTINGATKHYIEVMRPRWRPRGAVNPRDAHYLDCALRYVGAPASTITGLSHLNGQTVSVFADGAMQKDKVVAAGAITLDEAASNVLVGLPIAAAFDLLPAQFQREDGFSESLSRTPRHVAVRYHETSLAEVRGPNGVWQDVIDRAGGVMSSYVPVRSGLKVVDLDSEEGLDGKISFRAVGALPMTILAAETDVDLEAR